MKLRKTGFEFLLSFVIRLAAPSEGIWLLHRRRWMGPAIRKQDGLGIS